MANIRTLILICLLQNALIMAYGHNELSMSSRDTADTSTDASSEESEESEEEPQRRFNKQQWQYESMPLEFPRRSATGFEEKAKDKTIEREQRRRFMKREWDIEGNSHDYLRSRGENVPDKTELVRTKRPTTTTSTTTPPSSSTFSAKVDPPLSLRYRRIYNADETASVADYPFMAALLMNRQYWCAGVILDLDKVLTAAHCLQLQYNNRFFREYVKMLTVRVGSNNATAGGEILHVSEIFFHPNYKPDVLGFNFALLKLHKNITLDRSSLSIKPIDYSRDTTVPVDRTITFLGWGSVLGYSGPGGEVLLQKVDMPVYDLADCQLIYGRALVTRHNFCAGYITVAKNVCNHDAGGPAILDGKLVGILSFSAKRCDRPDRPAVFSTAGAVNSWLETVSAPPPKLSPTNLVSGLNRH